MIMMRPPEFLQPELVTPYRQGWPYRKRSGTVWKYAIVLDGVIPDEDEAADYCQRMTTVTDSPGRGPVDGWDLWQHETSRQLQEEATLLQPEEEEVLPASSAAVEGGANNVVMDEPREDETPFNRSGDLDSSGDDIPELEERPPLVTSKTNMIVTGFGEERILDMKAHMQRREVESLNRAQERKREGTRGKCVDWHGNELDRAAGAAFSL